MNAVPPAEMPTAPLESSSRDGERRYELIDGEWVERKMGARSSWITATVTGLLGAYLDTQGKGLLFVSDCGYKIFPHAPRLTRFPDVSFVRSGRLPHDEPPDGHMQIPPDLAVEVVSPNDLAEEIEERVMDYLRVGVPLVWVIYPKARCVRVLRPGGTAAQLTVADELQGGEVLPGFVCRVEELFRQKQETTR